MVIAWVILGCLAILAVIMYFNWKADRDRKLTLAALAQRLGLRFDSDADAVHDARYSQFEIFQRGHSRTAKNTLIGAIELFGRPCEVRCGDFRYRVDGGRTSVSLNNACSYFIIHAPWDAPRLVIRPETASDRIDTAAGFDDINFESVEFSRLFHVSSLDKRFAYDVLHPRMMEFLLAERPPMLVIDGGALCLGDGERLWIPRAFERQLAFVRRFAELWPRHLVKDLET